MIRTKASAYAVRWQAANPEKHAAHKAVAAAIKDGTLVRMPCEECGHPETEGHHDDYSKPLSVRWLCASHHIAHHHRMRGHKVGDPMAYKRGKKGRLPMDPSQKAQTFSFSLHPDELEHLKRLKGDEPLGKFLVRMIEMDQPKNAWEMWQAENLTEFLALHPEWEVAGDWWMERSDGLLSAHKAEFSALTWRETMTRSVELADKQIPLGAELPEGMRTRDDPFYGPLMEL